VSQANFPGINPAIAEDERSMALRIIEGYRVFMMLFDCKEFAHPIRDHA
jgi:hypothetical protein